MQCEQVKPILVEYACGEIASADRKAVDAHLKGCVSCREELADLRETVSTVSRAYVMEEPLRRFRIAADPAPRASFWLIPARLGFAAAGLFCAAIALLALFHTNVSYEQGNFEIAFGAPAVSSGATATGTAGPNAARQDVSAVRPFASSLDEAQVRRMIAEAVAASQERQQARAESLTKAAALDMQQQWRRDLGEMSGSMRYFQAAQTMMWKEQMQNQQLVSALIQRGAPDASAPLPVQQ